MNIKLSENWIRDFVKTDASTKDITEALSLTSVSVERIEKIENDFIYDIEVTQNRPDLMSAIGIAREVATVLPRFGKEGDFKEQVIKKIAQPTKNLEIKIINNPELVGRICAVELEVTVGASPSKITHRLETSGIRSLNNVIDVTNYVMRETGHPTHVFDLDRLATKTMTIRESKKGETVKTLDGKTHTLQGSDIVAENDKGEIIDLLGVMGTANSVVQNTTKRILFFIDNNDPHRIRKTSMNLGIRSEAAVLNEKGVDPELAMTALLRGIALFEEIANGRQISKIFDEYPKRVKSTTITISKGKIDSVIGVVVPEEIVTKSLPKLGFDVKKTKNEYLITVPTNRINDVSIPEDIVEEVARIYGYHNIPNEFATMTNLAPYSFTNDRFYWEQSAKNYLKNTGFTECYTYSMVSEDQYEGPLEQAYQLDNALNSEHVIMRKSIVPSLLEVIKENPTRDEAKIFELANTYQTSGRDALPREELHLAGIIKSKKSDFLKTKGVIENLFSTLGITHYGFKRISSGGEGADILLNKKRIGSIEIYDDSIHIFELEFDSVVDAANNKKNYDPIPLYPPIIEDIRLTLDDKTTYEDLSTFMQDQSSLIQKIALLDVYEDKKTFRIYYQDKTRNLTNEDIAPIREKLIKSLEKKFNAQLS